jgi:hypothetical protein
MDDTTPENGHQIHKDDGKFGHWANTFRRRKNIPSRITVRQSQCRQSLRTSNQNLSSSADSPTRSHFGHTKRLSDSSSGFVETVKTASFSKASISIGSRSHRLTRSTEIRGNRSSNVRYSIDSDRPITRLSLDEGALRHGLRRRQILRETLVSEESYLVDLSALSNLFSTLLTSVASFSSLTKASIQRNLLEILHLHTDLANELHRVSTIDISMHWMPECLLRKSGVRSRVKRGSLDTHYFQDGEPQICHSRHSVDSADSNAVLRTAEPSEVIDVSGAFEVSWLAFSSTRTTAPTTK